MGPAASGLTTDYSNCFHVRVKTYRQGQHSYFLCRDCRQHMGPVRPLKWHLRDQQKATIWRLHQEGMPNRAIAAQVGTSDFTVSHWVRRIYSLLGIERRCEYCLTPIAGILKKRFCCHKHACLSGYYRRKVQC